MKERRFFFYTRTGCHLCRRLEDIVEPILRKRRYPLTLRDIETNDEWSRRFMIRIPVLAMEHRSTGEGLQREVVLLEGNPTEQEIRRALSRL